MAATKAAKRKNLQRKLKNFLAAKDRGKAGYEEADKLLEELIAELKPGEEIELAGGRRARLVDNFAVKNKAWKPCGVNRYEVKVSDA